LTFLEKLLETSRRNSSWLCVGLDPDSGSLPSCLGKEANPPLEFCRRIIDATKDLVCAYKPNIAFFEVLGEAGWPTLREVIGSIPKGIPVILDAKRGDIGNTAKMYARAYFQGLGVDAVTVNPYMGTDSIAPFLEYEGKTSFILCLTSNPSATEFQGGELEEKPLYHQVAEMANSLNRGGNCGLVVGATKPEQLHQLRQLCPELPFLIPGVGAQGGDLESTVQYGSDEQGNLAIVNISRAILYACSEADFAASARHRAELFRGQINLAREQKTSKSVQP
jgi:orotidine-5'-phosphate decarboxylase